MEPRKQLLFRRDFAHSGITISEDAWQRRQGQIAEELMLDMPALRRLRSSRLEFSYKLEATALQILIFLTEIPQLNLPFGHHQNADNDIYLQDVKNVRENQRSLLESYELAYKSTRDPAQDERIRDLRQRLTDSSSAGHVHIHNSVAGEIYEFSDLPKYLPNSRELQVQAKVIELRVGEVTIVPNHGLLTDPDMTLLLRPGAKVNCFRSAECRQVSIGTRLQTAMDLKVAIKMSIVIERSWIDGRPSRVTLVEVPDER